MQIGQLCVEAACHKKIEKERPGVPDIRRKAFEAILDHDFDKMTGTYTGRLKMAYLSEALTGKLAADKNIREKFLQLQNLEQAKDLLARADWAFSPSSKVDLIVQKAIIDKQYDIMQLNVTLFKYTNEILGV